MFEPSSCPTSFKRLSSWSQKAKDIGQGRIAPRPLCTDNKPGGKSEPNPTTNLAWERSSSFIDPSNLIREADLTVSL